MRVKFDEETQARLRRLPAVEKVTANRITYTPQFRAEAVRRYLMGESPSKIFRSHGLGPETIGYKRIERCVARWRDSASDEDMDETKRWGIKALRQQQKLIDARIDALERWRIEMDNEIDALERQSDIKRREAEQSDGNPEKQEQAQ